MTGEIASEQDVGKEEGNLEDVDVIQTVTTNVTATEDITGVEKDSNILIGKLDESVYRMFGQQAGSVSSLSRSSSDTGGEGAVTVGLTKTVGTQSRRGRWECNATYVSIGSTLPVRQCPSQLLKPSRYLDVSRGYALAASPN